MGKGVEFELHGTLSLGSRVFISDGVSISVGPNAEVTIADDVFIGRNTVIAASEQVYVGERTLIAEHCSIRDGDHQPSPSERDAETHLRTAPLVIGSSCWIGAGARVLRGATLGYGVVVGANAVVKSPIADGATVVGAPARPVTANG